MFPVWSLFGPDGASVIPNCGGRCQSSLQSGGTFTVEVVDLFGFGTGPYVIDLEAISATFNGEPNGPPTPTCTRGGDGTQPIGCGETKSGRIDSRGETDTFTFTARPDEVVSITAAPVAADSAILLLPAWSLFGPDGTSVVDSCAGQCQSGPLPPPGGTFTIEVFDQFQTGTGSYNLSLEAVSATFDGASNGPPNPVCARGSDGTQAIACGQALSRRIDAPGETDTFTFTAQTGEMVSISVLPVPSGSSSPAWELFAPDGTSLTLSNGSAQCTGTCQSAPLPAPGGTFTIKVSGGELPGDTGVYRIALRFLVNECSCLTASACDDGDVCNGVEICENNVCKNGTPLDCDDHNPCTVDTCDPTAGCQHVSTATCCGNGVLEAPEQCDRGALNGAAGSCCRANCTLRPAGQICRPQVTFCDAQEVCNGESADCPADGFAINGTPCNTADPCTVKDVCQAGACTGGIRVCALDARSPCHEPGLGCEVVRTPPVRIDVRCQVNRVELRIGERGGFCEATAFVSPDEGNGAARPAARADGVPAAMVPAADDQCAGQPQFTDRRRQHLDKAGRATFSLKLNKAARKRLRESAVPLTVNVCGTLGLPQRNPITLKEVVRIARGRQG